jgi:hypothetical protein
LSQPFIINQERSRWFNWLIGHNGGAFQHVDGRVDTSAKIQAQIEGTTTLKGVYSRCVAAAGEDEGVEAGAQRPSPQ